MIFALAIRVGLAALELAAFQSASLAPAGFGPGGRFHLEHSKDSFGVRSHGIIEDLGDGRTKLYALPQSSFEEFARLRPDIVRMMPVNASGYERQEVIGPWQVEGDKLWFGNNFYDGEGDRGVGAFGYFDMTTRKYTIFTPPEVVPYEVSAILVEKDAVWIGLDHFGEDISTFPGGLVRWDRTTREANHQTLEFVIDRIQRQGEYLRFGTRYGHAMYRDGEVRRFLANGQRIERFPPPPSHY